jgi:thymidylate synthase
MWQEDDFENPGLNPCAFQTIWNVRHGKDGVDYLDMVLVQRSSDFVTAGAINQTQYAVFLCMVANILGYTPGQFTWFVDNIQIYDRHIEAAKELLSRESVECTPSIWINPDVKDWYDYTPEDIRIVGYPLAEIKEKNPQIKLDIAV